MRSDITTAKVTGLYNAGYSVAEIARGLNCNTGTVMRRLGMSRGPKVVYEPTYSHEKDKVAWKNVLQTIDAAVQEAYKAGYEAGRGSICQ